MAVVVKSTSGDRKFDAADGWVVRDSDHLHVYKGNDVVATFHRSTWFDVKFE